MENRLLLLILFLLFSIIPGQCTERELQEIVTNPSAPQSVRLTQDGQHINNNETLVDETHPPHTSVSRAHSAQPSVRISRWRSILATTEVWTGRACRILGKPLIAVGTGLGLQASLDSNADTSSLTIKATVVAGLGAFMDRIGVVLEKRGRNRATEIEKNLLNITSDLTPQEIEMLADAYFLEHGCIKKWDGVTSKLYNISGALASLTGMPLAFAGGTIYISGNNEDNASLAKNGIYAAVAGTILHTLGGELGKIGEEREAELKRFAKIEKAKATAQEKMLKATASERAH